MQTRIAKDRHLLQQWPARLTVGVRQQAGARHERLARAQLRLQLLDPRLVLERGYAWLLDADGVTVSSVHQLKLGDTLRAKLQDGEIDLQVGQQSAP